MRNPRRDAEKRHGAEAPEAHPHHHFPAMRGRKQMMRQGHTFQT